MLTLVEG